MKAYFKKNYYLLFVFCLLAGLCAFVVIADFSESRHNYSVEFYSPQKIHTGDLRINDNAVFKSELLIDKKLESDEEKTKEIDVVDENNPVFIKNIQEYSGSFSSDLMMAVDLQERFDSDAIDSVLASEAERSLSYVFYQGMEWQEFSPLEISCKKNMCRVKLDHSTQERIPILMELISNQMKNNNIGFGYAIPVSLPVEKINFIYFIKNN